MKKLPCTLDKVSRAVTFGVAVLCVFIFVSCYFGYERSGHDTGFLLMGIMTPLSLIIIIAGMYYLQPLSINVTEDKLIIDRKIKPVTIRLSEIKAVYTLPKEAMAYTIRTFGNGGLFGYTGYYYNRKQGTMLWYCTQRTNYVAIETINNKKIVITPDDPNALLQYLQTIMPEIIKA